MSACIVLLCNAQHNEWRWAFCITLCNHRNVFIDLNLYGWYEQYGKCSYIISGFLGLYHISYGG